MNNENNIVGDCPLCEEHSLHILGEGKHQTQQCINCGYVTSEKFKLNDVKKEDSEEYKKLTDDMREWSMVANNHIWIPTIMTLPIGMLYPQNVDNMVNHKTEMKWHFANMIEIPEEERKIYPVEGDSEKFYERRIDVENAKIYESFLDGMAEVNNRMKGMYATEQKKNENPNSPKLPKLKRV